MWKLAIFAALLAAVAAKNSYIVVSPSSFRPGISLNVSINILHATSPVRVEAALVDSKQQYVVSSYDNFVQGSPKTIQLQVPDGLHTGSYKLKVQGTGGLTFTNETNLRFESKSISIFIQTDKATYKPGQTVHFRAFGVFPNLTVYPGSMDVDIYDPNSNKIKQFKGLRDASGVITNYMIMDTQPVLGDWKIKVALHGRTQQKTFTVAHYVLPKFKVTVELPSYVLTKENTVTGKVKATYTYGKPVKGTVSLIAKIDHWYRPYNYHGDEPMVAQTLSLTNGEGTFNVPLAQIHQVQRYLNGRSLVVEANVTESINKITLSGSSKVQFYDQGVKLHFLSSNPNTFKPGLPYTAYLKVSQPDDVPLTGRRQDVNVTTTVTYELPSVTPTPYRWYQPPTRTYQLQAQLFTVPDTGMVAVQVDIPGNASHISLQAHYGQIRAYSSLSKSYSPSDNYIQLFLRSTNLRAGQAANFEVKSTETMPPAVYQVLSRGTVAGAGTFTGNTFSIMITDKMAPNARIVVYYVRTDGEVVTDSISFDVDGAFQNQVDLQFDTHKAKPGDNVHVTVTADPSSMVSLLAVDQSVLLLKSGNDITSTEVVDELKTYDTIAPVYGGFGGPIDFIGRKKRMAIWWGYPVYYGGSDANQIFQNAGVKVMTDALVYHHVERMFPIYEHHGFFMGGMRPELALAGGMVAPQGAGSATASHQTLKEPARVRNVFPETWLWSNATVGADGRVTIATTAPDTITSWVASAFAVNSVTGLGVSPSAAKLEVFRPFFVSLNLPYSVVRGEQLALQANVFNYMTQDMDVLVTLEMSNDFRNVIVDANGHTQFVSQEKTNTVHVLAGEAKSVFFPIVPAALGKITLNVKAQSTLAADAVRRQLLVEPEGVEKEFNTPVLIDLKNTTTFTKTVPLSLPATVVAGSPRAVVTAIGDLMGPTVNGLDKLLRMPSGCGEQTMLGFAPDIFVTDYLTATKQLTDAIEEKAINFMERGYQRELTYQHSDGSFSAFGDSDKSGSMWLSAFVIKSFHQAKKYIFIDDDTIARAAEWMINRQNPDGSFPEPGRVIHKDMQGGAAKGPGLTAFVLISLLENNDLGGAIQTRINTAALKALKYIEVELQTVTDDYVLAIGSYALQLAKSSSADAIFQKLKADAIVKDGMVHWHKVSAKPSSSHHYWSPAHKQSDPIDIEMSSYALLVEAARNQFTSGLPIMRWVTSQRNGNGGFSSTQDTIIGLQALSQFARMAYSDSFNIQATITAGAVTKTFTINQQNALVLQSIELPTIPGQVTISATGHGMALLQVDLTFNVEQEIQEPTFDVTVTLTTETIDQVSIKACTRWLLTGASGMAVQEFGIPSGFEADTESLAGIPEIKKLETENRKLILYFDEITTTPLCLTLDTYRTGMVAKSQPAPVRVYDYYQPSNQVTKFYQSHVLQNSDICDVCLECGCAAPGGR